MKNKKIFSFLIGVLFGLPLSTSAAAARADVYYKAYPIIDHGNYNYLDMGESAAILDYNGSEEHVNVPSAIDGKKVTMLVHPYSYGAVFNGLNDLKSAEIPEGVEEIGSYTFFNCTSLSEVKLPSTLTTVADNAFYGCGMLSELDIPESVSHIGDEAFAECGLKSAAIPEGLERIGRRCFTGCTLLSEVSLPSSLNVIPERAFYRCESLSRIELPENLTYIGKEAFLGNGLKSVKLPDNITVMGSGVFKDCTQLESAVLSNSLVSVEDEAFSGCGMLKDVVFPEGVRSLGKNLFVGCRSLKSVYIPKSVDSLGNLLLTGTGAVNVSYGGSWEEWNSLISAIPSEEADLWKINVGCDIPYPLAQSDGAEGESGEKAEEIGFMPIPAVLISALFMILIIADLILFKRVRRGPKTDEEISEETQDGYIYRFERLGEWKCDKCGTVNGSIGKYCFNCGKRRSGKI